tara:strand:+ start:432 stop:725 length:294 start_codon:yes stop_codon:yes gene_type:complete
MHGLEKRKLIVKALEGFQSNKVHRIGATPSTRRFTGHEYMDLSVLTITHEIHEGDFLAEEIVIADSPTAVEKNTERLIVLVGSRSWWFLSEDGCGKR